MDTSRTKGTQAAQSAQSAQSTETSDTELALRVARRDRAAFEQLYDRYAGKAFGLALKILGDRAISEEVTQEAFWRAWQRAETYDPRRASFSSWLLAIVHHGAIDELRRRRSSPEPVTMDTPDEATAALPDQRADVPERVWSNLQDEEVRSALAQLPEPQRKVIELAYFGGYTRQEIAARLNEPVGTVHTRARLGLLKLKEMLAGLK